MRWTALRRSRTGSSRGPQGRRAPLPQAALRSRRELVDAPAAGPRVQLPCVVDAERRHSADRPGLPASLGAAAIDVAAADRAALAVVVREQRKHELAGAVRRPRAVARAPLVDVPAVVRERVQLRPRPVIDLLPLALADIGDVEVAIRGVEAETPGIAQAVADDVPCRPPYVRIRAQQLSEPDREVLCAVSRIARRPSVAHADVQQLVGPELQLPAVVVRVRLRDEEDLTRARRNCLASARSVLDEARVAVQIGVVDVEAVVGLVRRAERDREQPALTAAGDSTADVEKGPAQSSVDEVTDAPDLLDDVEAPRLGRCRRD